LTSGIIVGGVQHGLVADGIHTSNQTTAAFEYRDASSASVGRNTRRSKAQFQSFFYQSRQAGALLCGVRFSAGEQGIVDMSSVVFMNQA
jgi:hypothetical protein